MVDNIPKKKSCNPHGRLMTCSWVFNWARRARKVPCQQSAWLQKGMFKRYTLLHTAISSLCHIAANPTTYRYIYPLITTRHCCKGDKFGLQISFAGCRSPLPVRQNATNLSNLAILITCNNSTKEKYFS